MWVCVCVGGGVCVWREGGEILHAAYSVAFCACMVRILGITQDTLKDVYVCAIIVCMHSEAADLKGHLTASVSSD